ncbi:MAG: fibronectin type III domain-containing protein [Solobacterium sp.]|nr:fibronectin type III domain-containing protein [Solobacterium sp.]
MKKTIFVVLAAVCLAVGILLLPKSGGKVQPENPGTSETTKDDIVDQFNDPTLDPFDFTDENGNRYLDTGEYPEKLDLREYGIVTPVRLQNPFGTCWGFAAAAAAETSLLGSGLAQEDGFTAETLNLSEKHLAYFVATALNDPDSPQNGEGLNTDKEYTTTEKMNIGGLPFMATSTFSSGIGPVHESADPVFEYHGNNKWTEKRMIDGRYQDYSYSGDDDWSIPEDKRFMQSYVLKESYILPSPAQKDEDGEYVYNETATKLIKEQLLNKRAVQIGFFAETFRPDQVDSKNLYLSKNWAHYTYDNKLPSNHAVTIVGWDDNYSRENFMSDHMPPKDGAWIVKNSWGSGERSFPDKGDGSWGMLNEDGVHTGYFMLSYYDQSLDQPEALEFDRVNTDEGYYLDELDYMPVTEVKAAETDGMTRMANVFTAEGCEKLEQVSCQTSFPETDVTYQVYLLTDEFQDPTDGKLVAEESAHYKLGGFHKITLREPVLIQKEQHYSIVVSQKTPSGKYAVNIPVANGDTNLITWNVGIINERESFLWMDDEWHDFSDADLREELLPRNELDQDMKYAFDNFPIKGYCAVQPKNLSMRVVGTTSFLSYKDQRAGDMYVRFTGDQGVVPDDDAKITWTLEKGGENILKVEPSEDGSQAHISMTGKETGHTYLYVTVTNIGTTVVKLDASKLALCFLEFPPETQTVYNGSELKPEPSVYNVHNELLKKDTDYTLSYSDNVKCGVMVVKAAGINDYHEETEGYLPVLPQRGIIRDAKSSGGKITVEAENMAESGITGYVVRWREKGTEQWNETRTPADQPSVVLKDTRKGAAYEVQVCGYIDTKDKAEEYYGIENEYLGEFSETSEVTCN